MKIVRHAQEGAVEPLPSAAAPEASPVGVVISEDNGRHLDDATSMIQGKNNAVPANTFAVPPAVAASERLHVALKRIVLHGAEPPA